MSRDVNREEGRIKIPEEQTAGKTKRVLLSTAYDGTNYCGWQVQKNGETIESVLNRTLSALFGREITVIGASRTDSGVHALGNVAVFDTDARMPAEKIAYALNSRLPEDIRIQRSFEVPSDFHPRKTLCIKTYEYRILNREFELPSERMNSYFFRRKLDVGRMQAACPYFLGEHYKLLRCPDPGRVCGEHHLQPGGGSAGAGQPGQADPYPCHRKRLPL